MCASGPVSRLGVSPHRPDRAVPSDDARRTVCLAVCRVRRGGVDCRARTTFTDNHASTVHPDLCIQVQHEIHDEIGTTKRKLAV